MIRTPAIVLSSGLLLAACAPAQPPAAPAAPAAAPAPAPTPVANNMAATDHYVAIMSATCGAFLGLETDDRAAAAMFYIGYTARRFGTGSINVGTIPSIGSLAVNYCEADPNRTVASVFAEAYQETRRW